MQECGVLKGERCVNTKAVLHAYAGLAEGPRRCNAFLYRDTPLCTPSHGVRCE
ncbi:hypothetical protein JZ751_025513 [Albula glossodonta]|uniref:Uncharacterized protein n=1 Tax=Albula glossodonta TaxID=121402 RepID=A0A8T2NE91_9TELE|nr:hypothetical protein JZ751_025513 [Albula glossodonta]